MYTKGVHLVTVDLEGLYGSIPCGKGVEVINIFLQERDSTYVSYNPFIMEFLTYILRRNILY